jgi:hypothetical protein
MKIRGRLFALLVMTLVMFSISSSLFFLYKGTNGALQKLKSESIAIGRDIAQLRYFSDELLTTKKFGAGSDNWSRIFKLTDEAVAEFSANGLLRRIMNTEADKRQRDVLANVWTLVIGQAVLVANLLERLSRESGLDRIDAMSLSGASPDAIQLDKQVPQLINTLDIHLDGALSKLTASLTVKADAVETTLSLAIVFLSVISGLDEFASHIECKDPRVPL